MKIFAWTLPTLLFLACALPVFAQPGWGNPRMDPPEDADLQETDPLFEYRQFVQANLALARSQGREKKDPEAALKWFNNILNTPIPEGLEEAAQTRKGRRLPGMIVKAYIGAAMSSLLLGNEQTAVGIAQTGLALAQRWEVRKGKRALKGILEEPQRARQRAEKRHGRDQPDEATLIERVESYKNQ